jgi:hypothetical protein
VDGKHGRNETPFRRKPERLDSFDFETRGREPRSQARGIVGKLGAELSEPANRSFHCSRADVAQGAVKVENQSSGISLALESSGISLALELTAHDVLRTSGRPR